MNQRVQCKISEFVTFLKLQKRCYSQMYSVSVPVTAAPNSERNSMSQLQKCFLCLSRVMLGAEYPRLFPFCHKLIIR
jgi:hypothetical protein